MFQAIRCYSTDPRTPIYAEGLGTVSDSAGSWTNVVSLPVTSGRLEASTDYMVVWTADVSMSLNTSRVGARLTKDGAAVVTANREPRIAGDWMPVGGAYIYTTPATPVDVTFTIDIERVVASGTAQGKNGRLTLLKMTANDKHTTTTARATMTSSTFATKATLSFTPASIGDYIYVATFLVDGSDLSRAQVRFNDGSAGSTFTIECNGTSSRIPVTLIWYRSSVAASAQSLRVEQASLLATTIGISEIRIVALRVDDFANVYSNRLSANDDGDETSYTATATQTFTPAAEYHLTLASWAFSNANGDQVHTRLSDDGLEVDAASPHDTNAALTIHFPGVASRVGNYTAVSRTQSIQRKGSNPGTDSRVCAGSAIACLDLGGRY